MLFGNKERNEKKKNVLFFVKQENAKGKNSQRNEINISLN